MHSQFAPGGEPIDLTNCDREPIHTPGTIQPHGAFVAIDPATERILAASANCAAFIGAPPADVVNALATDIFGAKTADALRAAVTEAETSRPSVVLARGNVVATVHRTPGTITVEIEPYEEPSVDLSASTRDAVRRCIAIADVDRLCDTGAHELRALTGYDRVMIYRFDPDGHGHVIAEARAPELEAYLGRHYPASDIPRQARALYKTAMLRLIVDVNAPPSPIEPQLDPRSGTPWDLSNAILRSSSPIHLEYLRNMGVTATMTVSLLRDGELWGLIACHHYSTRFVRAGIRYATETIGHALVARIVALEDARISAARIAARDAVLEHMLRTGTGSVDALVNDRTLHAAIGVHGAAFVNGRATTAGNVPAAEQLLAIVAWLGERSGSDRFVTDALAKLNPSFAAEAAVASGIFAVRHQTGWFLAFRGEDAQTVDWGGDPTKPAVQDGERLSPRGSFALWREEVRQRAIPWEPWTLEALERAIAWSTAGGPDDYERLTAAQLLRDASDALAVTAGYRDTIERVAELAVPRIAALCFIDVDEGGSFTRRAAVVDPAFASGSVRLEAPHPDVGEGPGAVMRSGRTLIYGRGWFDALSNVDPAFAQFAAGSLAAAAVVPLLFDHKPIGVLTLGLREPADAIDQTFVEDFARLAAVAISNARLLEEARRARDYAETARARLSFVARAGGVLARSFDRDTTLQRLLATTIVDFADGAYAAIVEPDGTLAELQSGRAGGTALETLALRAMRDARTRLEMDTQTLAVPLLTGGRVVGALSFARGSTRLPFSTDDLTMIEEVAARAAMFVETARSFMHQRNVAQTLQRAFRPRDLPAIPGIAISAAYEPGTADIDVGGDWYDVIVMEGRRIAFVIGDVMGHGVEAAAAMAELRSGVRAHFYADAAPGHCLGHADKLLTHGGEDRDMFATAVAALYDLATRELTIANAGHPSPYVRRASGEIEALVGPAPLLGIDAGVRTEVSHRLASGDIVMFFTDGVVEDRGLSYDDGQAALEDVLRSTAGPALMIERIMALTGAAADDRTVLAFIVE